MIKNKWMWTGLLVCACIAAAVAVRPSMTKTRSLADIATVTEDAKLEVRNADVSTAVMNRNVNANKASATVTPFGPKRAITDADRNLMTSVRTRTTEADKQAAIEARSLLPRNPRVPSLDQGSDNCAGVPDLGSALGVAVATGTTVGATNNLDTTGWGGVVPACWQGGAYLLSTNGPDVYYKWTAPAAGEYTFSLCQGSANGNQYDTGITLWNFTCPTEPSYPANFICGNDDGGICENNYGSQLTCIPLTQGQQILIVIDGYDTDAGAYSLDITSCSPCTAPTCPPGSTLEGEPVCGTNYNDTYNGGCNSNPSVFQTVTCPDTLCGESGTFTVNDTLNTRDTDWYRLVLTDTTLLTCYTVAEFPLLSFTLSPGPVGFACDSLDVVGGPFTADACDTLVVSGCLPPGEYWIFIAPSTFTDVPCGSEYVTWWTCEPCVIDTSCVDLTLNVTCPGPSSISGSTIGAGNDCWVTGTTQNDTLSEDQIIQVNIATAGLYRFSLCGSAASWDSYMFVTDGCCSGSILNDFAATDDGCGVGGGLSQTVCIQLAAGTYYVLVEGWQASDAGAYTLEVQCCAGCEVTCVLTEAEGECDSAFVGTNDGCNLAVPSFETVTCGQTVCGRSGTYQINDTTNGRDLDWYVLNIADTSRITLTGTAEYAHNVWILSSNCAAPVTQGFATNLACSTATASACVRGPGNYYIVVGPSTFTGVPCGARYQFTVTCEPCVIPPSVTECPVDDIYSQVVDLPGNPNGLTVALADSSNLGIFQRWDKFVIPGGTDICDLHWWGVHLGFSGGFINCETEDPMTFRIRFYPDSTNNRPRLSHTFERIVTLNRTPMNVQYSLNGPPQPAQGYYYSVDFDTCVTLDSGWVSIQGTSAASPNCLFYWITSGGSTGGQSWLKNGAGALTTQAFNLSMCLTTRIPCDPVTNLTVYHAPGGGAAWLNFTAPQDAIYKIYSTTNPNADEDPDNGGDPDYTLEASVFFSAGIRQWTASAGFANYKKYVVVADCN